MAKLDEIVISAVATYDDFFHIGAAVAFGNKVEVDLVIKWCTTVKAVAVFGACVVKGGMLNATAAET